MGAAAALGSAIVVPLALNGFGWRGALMVLMVFPLLALIIWLPQCRQTANASLSNSRALHSRAIWRSSLAWQVTLFLGINSLIYYVIIGWLPAILISHGYSEAQAGSLHGLLQLATAAPGLLIPLVLNRFKDQRAIAALVSLMCAVGAAGFAVMPGQALLWTILFGFGSGATMILGLTFIGLRASSAHQAAALSGMAQSVGYLLAACGPPLMGKIHDLNGSWLIPLAGVAVLAILMAVFGLCAGRNREDRKRIMQRAGLGTTCPFFILAQRAALPELTARVFPPALHVHAERVCRQKRMRHQLNGTDITSLIPASHTKITALKLGGKIFRYAIVAVIPLGYNTPSVGFGNQRIGPQFNIIRFLYQRAGQRCDDHPPPVSVSAWAASLQPSTLRAYSRIAC